MAPKHRLYTPEIAETILERLADGEGLIAICRDEGMPSDGAVRGWVESDHDGFAARYAQARARGVERLADEILEISDDGRNDWMETRDEGNEGWRLNGEHVQRSKLRADNRKWLLSKLIPKTYGDKLDLNHSGGLDLKALPDDRVELRLADLLGKAGIVGAVGGEAAPRLSPPDRDDVSGDRTSEA